MPDPNRQFAGPKVTPNQKKWALLHFKMNIDSMIKNEDLLNKVKLEPNYNLFLERSKYKGEGSEYLTK